MIGEAVQLNQRPEFVDVPIFDHHDLALGRARDILGVGFFVVEQIGSVAAHANVAAAVDHEGFAQPALDLVLRLLQRLSKLRVSQKAVRLFRQVQIGGERIGVLHKPLTVLLLISLRGLEAVAHHPTHPVGKPAFQTHVHGENGEDRDQHRRNQRDDREHPGQPQVEPRPRRFRPARLIIRVTPDRTSAATARM